MKIYSTKLAQIRYLFEQAYTANIGMLAAGVLIFAAFIYAKQPEHIYWFGFILLIAIASRVLITISINKKGEDQLKRFAKYYTVACFVLGLDFAFISLMHYDLHNHDLRIFLTIVNIGIVTAAIATLSVWMQAYLAFSVPQLLALIAIFILNGSIFGAIAVGIFSGFILTIATNFNKKFTEGQQLINENDSLIVHMENEIKDRKSAQHKLEEHKQELEIAVASRTSELEKINENLGVEIEKRQVIEKKLEYLAYYDELTDLPNRALFIESLKNALSQAKRNETLLGVLFIDLDRFKKINDSHGHFIGDKLLHAASRRLRKTLRDCDQIARNGGDEFVIFLENMKDASEPFIVANKIIELMNKRFHIDGHDIHIGASIGISLYPLDGDTALDLLKNSDTAMYEAKNIGGNNFQFYSSAMSNQITDRLKIENALRDALKNNEFYLVYQPQVNIVTQKTTGFEALIRWNSPEFGLVSPIKFIPVLEETGLIYSVGEWIILEVLDFIKSGKSHNTKVSINLSPLQCGSSNYSAKIKRFIDAAGVNPSLIEFEITESLLISDFIETEMFLTDISNLGCTIALDDFGTGYTSFSYLTMLPIDIIKIDRSLVSGINEKKNLQDIVGAIVTMSKSLGIDNVFEGVENEEELRMVKQLNGAVIQGYFFSKPLEATEIDKWLYSSDNSKSNNILKM